MPIIVSNLNNVKPIHKELIANHLLSGKSITQAQFCDMVSKASRLAPRILNLKQDGYPIMKNTIKLDDGTHVAEYFLPRDFIDTVYSMGIEYAINAEREALEVANKARAIVRDVEAMNA